MPFGVAHITVGASGAGDDRCLVQARADCVVIVVADGAGGSGRGASAATWVVDAVARCHTDFDVAELLCACDLALAPRRGETTAVVAVVRQSGISGASVGDSEAWLFDEGAPKILTHRQNRKPLIGSGRVEPVSFHHRPLRGTLIMASDGLFKYSKRARLQELALAPSLDKIPAQLVDAARLPSGRLQDDIALVVCRAVNE